MKRTVLGAIIAIMSVGIGPAMLAGPSAVLADEADDEESEEEAHDPENTGGGGGGGSPVEDLLNLPALNIDRDGFRFDLPALKLVGPDREQIVRQVDAAVNRTALGEGAIEPTLPDLSSAPTGDGVAGQLPGLVGQRGFGDQLSQTIDAPSGDAVTGSQVTGIVGPSFRDKLEKALEVKTNVEQPKLPTAEVFRTRVTVSTSGDAVEGSQVTGIVGGPRFRDQLEKAIEVKTQVEQPKLPRGEIFK